MEELKPTLGWSRNNSKFARWPTELSNLQFKVHHKPGMAMGHVDGLSRLPGAKSEPSDGTDEIDFGNDEDAELELDEEPTDAKNGDTSPVPTSPSQVDLFGLDSKVGVKAYRIEIPTHPDKIVTVSVNRLKKFRGRWTRPYMDEVPPRIENEDDEVEDGPLEEADLPPSSFTERMTIGREVTAILGTDVAQLEVVAKRVVNRVMQYLVLTTTYENFWLPRIQPS
ncbi:unnamed protein product [Phytophthora lilii]|uniref:Unnamed protein product n=1 Tax=Phytophthora lilii TaxID=2077276 RepID=A0A9W6WJX2_9STRA|nr:unnamed protein product [Phytophthora lilii]